MQETAFILNEGVTIGEKPLKGYLELIGHKANLILLQLGKSKPVAVSLIQKFISKIIYTKILIDPIFRLINSIKINYFVTIVTIAAIIAPIKAPKIVETAIALVFPNSLISLL